jgi:excisionase family DNA binding protein
VKRQVKTLIQLEIPGFTVREASTYLGVRRETVFAWIHSKRIDATLDVCGQYRIPCVELHRLLRERENLE